MEVSNISNEGGGEKKKVIAEVQQNFCELGGNIVRVFC